MAEGASSVSYEDLAAIEDEFDQIDTEILRKQYQLTADVYAKRNQAVAKVENFWPLVFEQAPPEIDQYIQPQDSRIFAESLINVEVRRPELDGGATGNPRSLQFRFEFKPNADFENAVLEKTFWHRRAKDGWTGLVSEPVRVDWKKGKDVTEGLTDMARALFEARTKLGDMTARGLPEYTALKKKVEHWNGMNTSFFTWFGWVSGRRWVSAEESEKANAEYAALRARRQAGEKVDVFGAEDAADGDEEDEDDDDEAVEVHQAGEDLAVALAEDLWPNAIKFFTQAQEIEEMSDMDFEEDDDDDDNEGDDEPIDIRSLVQDRGGKSQARNGHGDGDGPPSKKQKK